MSLMKALSLPEKGTLTDCGIPANLNRLKSPTLKSLLARSTAFGFAALPPPPPLDDDSGSSQLVMFAASAALWRTLRALYSSALRRSLSSTLIWLSSLISQILDAPATLLLLAVDELGSVWTEI